MSLNGKRLTEDLIFLRTKQDNVTYIKNLNLWGNDLEDISYIKELPNLEIASLSVNNIKTLKDFSTLKSLKELYLRKNLIADFKEVLHLINLVNLKTLWLNENPISLDSKYRLIIIKLLPQLMKLDDLIISNDEKLTAEKFQLKSIGDFFPISNTNSNSNSNKEIVNVGENLVNCNMNPVNKQDLVNVVNEEEVNRINDRVERILDKYNENNSQEADYDRNDRIVNNSNPYSPNFNPYNLHSNPNLNNNPNYYNIQNLNNNNVNNPFIKISNSNLNKNLLNRNTNMNNANNIIRNTNYEYDPTYNQVNEGVFNPTNPNLQYGINVNNVKSPKMNYHYYPNEAYQNPNPNYYNLNNNPYILNNNLQNQPYNAYNNFQLQPVQQSEQNSYANQYRQKSNQYNSQIQNMNNINVNSSMGNEYNSVPMQIIEPLNNMNNVNGVNGVNGVNIQKIKLEHLDELQTRIKNSSNNVNYNNSSMSGDIKVSEIINPNTNNINAKSLREQTILSSILLLLTEATEEELNEVEREVEIHLKIQNKQT